MTTCYIPPLLKQRSLIAPMRYLITLLAVLPGTALAHAPVEGVNHFVNGLLHPVLVPAHAILLLGLGMLIGRQGHEDISKVMPVFLMTVIPAILLSMWSIEIDLQPILLVTATLIGGLLIWGQPLPIIPLMIVTVCSAVLIGIDSPQETFSGKDRYIAFFGTVIGASFIVVYLASLTELFQKWLNGIAIRVLGSWLVAGSLMVLALGFQG